MVSQRLEATSTNYFDLLFNFPFLRKALPSLTTASYLPLIGSNSPRAFTKQVNGEKKSQPSKASMCVFIYTLPQLCCHPQFQNVCECALARGTFETETKSLTLTEPKFLFDTSKSGSKTPAYYRARFPCKKRKAIRPVPTMCARCLEEQAGAAKINTVDVQRQRLDVLVESSSSDGGQSLGSSVGLVPASGSSSSGMTTASGMLCAPGVAWYGRKDADVV